MTMTLSGDGTITGLVAGGLPDATVTQAEVATGVSGTGPAFSAYLNTTQSVTDSVFTKLQASVEEFDTNSNYNSSTNYRFTPTVAGYYQINGNVYVTSSVSVSVGQVSIFKNGSRFKDGNYTTGSSPNIFLVVSSLIYLNGSTDYVELFGYMSGSGSLSFGQNNGTLSYFQGYLARAA